MDDGVTVMKLVPVDRSSDSNNLDLPTLTRSNVNMDKSSGKLGDLTTLDEELLQILHNNDLSDDAKAKLYWVALHKSEIYKDKSMWTEPTIVELRENR